MKFNIIIHRLDPDEEQRQVIDCLKKDGIIPKFDYSDASEDRNAVRISICTDSNIEMIEEAVNMLSDDTLNFIHTSDLSISIYTDICSIPEPQVKSDGMVQIYNETAFLSVNLLSSLKDKNIGIYIHAFSQ